MAKPEPDWDEKTDIEVEAGKVVSVTRTRKATADTQPARDLRPVNSLVLLPDNPRHGDIGALTESLARFGQQKPIVINPDGVILAGNHTFQAAVALGWEQIWVNESSLEGSDQPAFALADKQTTQLMAGGNTDALYRPRGTLPKSQMLVREHPDVARLHWRYGRWHHYVDYRPFRNQALIPDPDFTEEPAYDLRLVSRHPNT